MAPRRRLALAAAAVAAVAVAGAAAIFASPYLALRTLATAVQNQDATTVAEHVDFPALREDLKGQLLLRMQREMARPGGQSQPFSGLGQMFALGLANQMLDSLVSPTGVALALKNGAVLRGMAGSLPADGAGAPQDAESSGNPPQTRSQMCSRGCTVRYINWSTVQVQPRDGTGGVTLRRDRLVFWKVVAVDLSVLKNLQAQKR